jgi:hypothetical protein
MSYRMLSGLHARENRAIGDNPSTLSTAAQLQKISTIVRKTSLANQPPGTLLRR